MSTYHISPVTHDRPDFPYTPTKKQMGKKKNIKTAFLT